MPKIWVILDNRDIIRVRKESYKYKVFSPIRAALLLKCEGFYLSYFSKVVNAVTFVFFMTVAYVRLLTFFWSSKKLPS